MAFNRDLIRNKLTQLKNKGNGKRISDYLWKPEVGEHVVRIVENNDPRFPLDPFHELYFHYRFMGKNYLSPATFGNPDPLMEFAQELSSQGNKEAWQESRKFRGVMRTYVPVLIRGKEAEGVKWWGFGITIYNELMGFFDDDDWGNLADATNGHDIKVTVTKDPSKDYPSISVAPKPRPSAVSKDKPVLNSLKEIPQLVGEVYTEATYQELEKALERFMATGGEEEETTPNQQPGAQAADKTSDATPEKKTSEAGLKANESEGSADSLKDFMKEFEKS